jgi:hypothetical protein
MKNLSAILLLAISLFFASCDKKTGGGDPIQPTSTVKLAFKATFDGQDLKKNTDYMFGTNPVQFIRFTLFVSNVTLLKGTTETKLTEAEFLEFFSETNASNDSEKPTFSYPNVLSDDYTGIKIDFGMAPALNSKRPSDFPATHALSNETEYWLGWKSYIFSKIEANAELGADTTPNNYESFLNYHCGSTTTFDVSSSHTFSQTIDISGNEKVINVELDLKKLFLFGTKMLDITNTANQVTGAAPSDLGLAKDLMANWKNATTIK